MTDPAPEPPRHQRLIEIHRRVSEGYINSALQKPWQPHIYMEAAAMGTAVAAALQWVLDQHGADAADALSQHLDTEVHKAVDSTWELIKAIRKVDPLGDP